ncbi:MAG TPA: aspartate--tRNA(Asn) ligase, partial [Dehalococcoidia bacterium]|nr:aspartate--tRNA(Asn) ligase [Dehalococcoidia bacterium]
RVGERVRLAGWLHHQRRLARLTFVLLRDRSGIAQVVVDDPAAIETVARLLPETVLEVEARVTTSDQAPDGVELRDPVFTVLSEPAEQPPIELRRPVLKEQLPTILDHAAVALRHPARRTAFQIAAASVRGFRAALDALGFVEIQSPKIVAAATEGGANVFALDYFGRPAYLAQSPQFYKQIMVGVFERVFEVGPVFRAEPHDTPRHLNEYVSLDAEFGFIDDHTAVMALLTEVLRGMLATIAARCGPELALLRVELPSVPEAIPVLHFGEAQELLARASGEDPRGEPDLAPAHERWLGDWARREHGSDLLFISGYPMVKRPFYTHPDPARPAFSNSFDLLFRGLELVTGGQRLHLYADYLAALTTRGLDPANFEHYLEAFKYGMPPHGGFAIGLERFVGRLIEASNIRETTLFPRDLNRLAP